MLLLGMWGFHSPIPCGCATVESGSHLNQVQAAVCLVSAHFSPASPGGLFGDGGMDKHHHSHPPWGTAQPLSDICGLACAGNPPLQSRCSSSSPRRAMLCHTMQSCAMLCCDVPGCAMPCHAMPCTAGWKRGVTDLLAEGARRCSCGRGPSLCVGTGCAVLLRNRSARGMIDLVSAGGGLSQCQASAQMGALKGESPFPLLKAEQQSPCHQPRPCSHIMAIIGPTAAGSCPALGSA